jgi:hypothetical protein
MGCYQDEDRLVEDLVLRQLLDLPVLQVHR